MSIGFNIFDKGLPWQGSPHVLLVGAVFDEVVYHRRVGQCRCVTECAQVVFGNLAQDAAHNLTGAGLGQAGGPLNDIGLGDGADFLFT